MNIHDHFAESHHRVFYFGPIRVILRLSWSSFCKIFSKSSLLMFQADILTFLICGQWRRRFSRAFLLSWAFNEMEWWAWVRTLSIKYLFLHLPSRGYFLGVPGTEIAGVDRGIHRWRVLRLQRDKLSSTRYSWRGGSWSNCCEQHQGYNSSSPRGTILQESKVKNISYTDNFSKPSKQGRAYFVWA